MRLKKRIGLRLVPKHSEMDTIPSLQISAIASMPTTSLPNPVQYTTNKIIIIATSHDPHLLIHLTPTKNDSPIHIRATTKPRNPPKLCISIPAILTSRMRRNALQPRPCSAWSPCNIIPITSYHDRNDFFLRLHLFRTGHTCQLSIP